MGVVPWTRSTFIADMTKAVAWPVGAVVIAALARKPVSLLLKGLHLQRLQGCRGRGGVTRTLAVRTSLGTGGVDEDAAGGPQHPLHQESRPSAGGARGAASDRDDDEDRAVSHATPPKASTPV